MSGLKPKNVHVLFVHGVGAHAQLSSLFQAYQSFRSFTYNAEAPIEGEDRYPSWKLREFDQGTDSPTARLKLEQTGAAAGDTQNVYLYEVNYSALADVIRRNHEVDLTELFVSFDLAVNVARHRLKEPIPPKDDGFAIDHMALAGPVQKLAGVLVAATVPILGIPSLVFKRFTQNAVGVFSRFFEDITTFALDPNGERLISLHVDHTVRGIVESDCFNRHDRGGDYAPDELVIAGHSLGSIVTHSYLVRHRAAANPWLPQKVLTFGSPIGLVSWLWLFLDFERMDFKFQNASKYFCWTPSDPPGVPPAPIQWINVVNHMDPIATAFPLDYVDLAGSLEQNAASLKGGRIHQRFIDTGETGASADSAHTSYFEDRKIFLRILGRMAGLELGDAEELANPDTVPPAAGARSREEHWRKAKEDLEWLRYLWWAIGAVTLLAYLGGIAWLCRSPLPLLFMGIYGWPWLTIGSIAFFQRLFFSHPTKRTAMQDIRLLPCDRQSRPHCIRNRFRGLENEGAEADYVFGRRPGFFEKIGMWLLSFGPTFVAMVLPVVCAWLLAPGWSHGWDYFVNNLGWQLPLALGLFTGYLICYALSEFLRHWRDALEVLVPLK